MTVGLRIFLGLIGAFFLLSGLNWVFDPNAAAEGLGIHPLPDAVARSTLIGDLGAFFLSAAIFALLGAFTGRSCWLLSTALLFGAAAVMRTVAWAMHGADFAIVFIAIEVAVTAVFLFAASRAD